MVVLLKVRHFGAFGVFHADGRSIPLGAKHQALLALLTTGEGGVRTRSFLENTLWCLSQPEQAKASLRTALSTLKRHLGSDAAKILVANRERVTLKVEYVEIDEDPAKGEFMEGFELSHEERFAKWLEKMRGQFQRPNIASSSATGSVSKGLRNTKDSVLPTIAVLPFQVSKDGDAPMPNISFLTEDLTRCLARSQSFSVTSFLAAKSFEQPQASRTDAGGGAQAAFMVGGYVSINRDHVTIDLDLHDTQRQKLIWSRRYEDDATTQEASGAFVHTQRMVRDIARTIWGDAMDTVSFTQANELENHTLLMSAIAMMQMGQRAMFDQAKDILRTLAERENNHPTVRCWQGIWHVMRFEHGLSDSRAADMAAARHHAEAALAVDPLYSLAHALNGMIASKMSYNFDAAYASLELALEDNPNEALALGLKGLTCAYLDMPERAIALTDAAVTLSPSGPQKYYFDTMCAVAHLSAGAFERATEHAERALSENPGFPPTIRVLSVVNQIQRIGGSGRDAIKLLMSKMPEFSLRSPRRSFGELPPVQPAATGIR